MIHRFRTKGATKNKCKYAIVPAIVSCGEVLIDPDTGTATFTFDESQGAQWATNEFGGEWEYAPTHLFALIKNGSVTRVELVDIEDCSDDTWTFSEEIGQEFCEKKFEPGLWLQTCPFASVRDVYASVGYLYDEQADKFIPT